MAAITLGAAVAKAACGVWFGDVKGVGEVGNSIIDLATQKQIGASEQRRFRRFWEDAGDQIAERLRPLIEQEFRDLPSHEVIAAVDAVRDTFQTALSPRMIYSSRI